MDKMHQNSHATLELMRISKLTELLENIAPVIKSLQEQVAMLTSEKEAMKISMAL